MMIKKNTQEEVEEIDIDTATKLRNTDIDSTNEEIKKYTSKLHTGNKRNKTRLSRKFMSNSIVIIVILNVVIHLRVDQYVYESFLHQVARLHNEHHHSVVVMVILVVHEFSSFVLLIDKLYIIILEHQRLVNRDYHFASNSYADYGLKRILREREIENELTVRLQFETNEFLRNDMLH